MRSAGSAVDTRVEIPRPTRRAWSSTDDTTSPDSLSTPIVPGNGRASTHRASRATAGSVLQTPRLPGPRSLRPRRRTTSRMASVWEASASDSTTTAPAARSAHRSRTSGSAAAGPATTTRSTPSGNPSSAAGPPRVTDPGNAPARSRSASRTRQASSIGTGRCAGPVVDLGPPAPASMSATVAGSSIRRTDAASANRSRRSTAAVTSSVGRRSNATSMMPSSSWLATS